MDQKITLEISIDSKKLIFDSELHGLVVEGINYLAEQDGVLIYDKTKNLKSDEVRLQLSTNTSTLVPALRILGISYNPYFDDREVIESQNDITFYWNKSKLAAFYNKYSTDGIDLDKREQIIKEALDFLTSTAEILPLEDEFLNEVLEMPILLGFYKGFPIFDSKKGFAKLQSRLGIHLDNESIMISTPLDKYEHDVYEIAEEIKNLTKLEYSKKKNRVIFEKDPIILKLLNID